MDVPTAFLNGVLDTDVYIYPPEGMEMPDDKVLYGLKRSVRLG